MTDSPEDLEPKEEPSPSRRRFLSWFSQVIVGASLVGIGLSLGNSRNALAASQTSNVPDCIPCTAHCEFHYCINNNCDPYPYAYSISYTVYQNACVEPGQQCPYTNWNYCGRSCCDGVPGNCGCP
jgi:hypothetical protein